MSSIRLSAMVSMDDHEKFLIACINNYIPALRKVRWDYVDASAIVIKTVLSPTLTHYRSGKADFFMMNGNLYNRQLAQRMEKPDYKQTYYRSVFEMCNFETQRWLDYRFPGYYEKKSACDPEIYKKFLEMQKEALKSLL